ncbi:putative entry exclusion protein TrbK-alt [Bradyrhizobium sp. SZCCHNR3015]|uniref:putative entry exclusion protein TrbK-alt n=1 Tax=Bradyrhizobium sp. SZCCHNR3015 TaxID=3057395 RepID=UPI0029163756|nr:putative entry exclusion protein TrbK-alt [Bradyrhizobium sp. SZCCHNR3015]
MSPYLTSQQFLRSAAVGFVTLAAAVAVVQSRRGEDTAIRAPVGRGEAEAHANELARCRTITLDDAAGFDACRRIWAENRQHFFVSGKSPRLPVPPAADAAPVFLKSQDRVQPQSDQEGVR